VTIPSSGQSLSFSALRTEFVGGSSAISLGDLYRGGSNIRAKHPTNNATNDAANVPESGALDVSDFYDQGKSFTFTYSSSGTDQNLSDLFGSTDYGVDYPKNVVIPASITLGTASTSEYALEADSGGAGTITITNNGNIIGAGGAGGSAGSANGGTGGNGSAGGDAFKASVAVTLVNNGSMLAGGGGGSGGGGGGQGGALQQQSQQQTTAQQGPSYQAPASGNKWTRYQLEPGAPTTPAARIAHQGPNLTPGQQGSRVQMPSVGAPGPSFPSSLPYNQTSVTQGQYTYYRGPQNSQGYIYYTGMENPQEVGIQIAYSVYRRYPQQSQQQNQVSGHSGGAGGAGGLGRGFQNQPGGDAGASGSAGSTGQAGNGGAGGDGGTGGGYGQAGGAGQDGATGTSSTTSGSAGGNDGSVGAAGNYIEGISNVTFTNNGTVAGGTE
tara:strand:- start:4446 stop:5762 length:1317 start_codon:yes stop_codon:yes gene_type:complete